MVERLSTLLREEAAALDVPAAPAEAILALGRRGRRRRRVTEVVAGLAAVTVVVAGTSVVVGRGGSGDPAQQRFDSAAAGAAYDDYGAFSVGSTVYVGNHQVTFPEKIKALYYTSEGVLVRMGDKATTDEPGPSHYTLVHPDGTTKDIDLRMRDRIAGTDPDSAYVAYAEPAGATGDLTAAETRRVRQWSFVVVDLATGAEVARTTVSGTFTWGGWEAPPVDTAGTRMWALFDTGWMEFDWATGTTRTIPETAKVRLESAHGRYADFPNWANAGTGQVTVRDFITNDLVATIPMERSAFATLSPDGRSLQINQDQLMKGTQVSSMVSVDSGKATVLPGDARWGWTPDGHALSVDQDADQITVCDPTTGDCDRIDLEVGSGKLKLGGLSYES